MPAIQHNPRNIFQRQPHLAVILVHNELPVLQVQPRRAAYMYAFPRHVRISLSIE
jgi:hypothetical protein